MCRGGEIGGVDIGDGGEIGGKQFHDGKGKGMGVCAWGGSVRG